MYIIKQFLGVLYILCILIIAMDIMYFLFVGILHGNIKEIFSIIFNPIDNIAKILCLPVSYLIDIALNYLPPFFKKILPITDTGVFGAKIAWSPTIALFTYTGILRYIDEFLRSKRIREIQKDENESLFVKHSEIEQTNIVDDNEKNTDNKI